MLGKNFSSHFEIFFSLFSQIIEFDIICELSPWVLGDNLLEMSMPIFWKKKFKDLLSATLALSVVMVNTQLLTKI